LKPWFPPEDKDALEDFFSAYAAHVDIWAIVRLAAEEDPSFAEAAQAMAPHWTKEGAREKRETLTNAFRNGNWEPYEADLRQEAVLYAQNSITNWQLITRVLARMLTPKLVEKLESSPRRLANALRVMHEFLERARGVLTTAYLEQRQTMLRDAEQRAARIIESMMVGVWVLNHEGRTIFMNARLAAILGISVEEGLVTPVTQYIDPEYDADLEKRLADRKAGKSGSYEQQFKRKNGTRGHALIESSPLFDANGNFEGILSMVTDITEKREAEAALKASAIAIARLNEERVIDARFRALLEAAPDAMVIVDDQGKIALVNAQTESLFGYKREELLDQPVEILIPERFRHRHESVHRGSYFSSPSRRPMATRPEVELVGLRKDGMEFPIEVTLGPLHTEDRGLLVSSAIRDITDRRRIETALRVSNRELEAFSYSVAHDLRGPLRGINGFAQILLEDYAEKLDGEGTKFLRHITDSAVRMADLIDGLLSLARVTRAELNPQRTNLSHLARAIVSELSTRDATIRPVIPEIVIGEGIERWVDPTLARVVLDNLLGNAWKFTQKKDSPRARIELGVMPSPSNVVFVKDNGAGFDMAHAEKLFAPFQRLHPHVEFPGTGIGLATAHRIIDRHSGKIWAEGRPNEGATFFFQLPLVAEI